jgi:hypothetical protein
MDGMDWNAEWTGVYGIDGVDGKDGTWTGLAGLTGHRKDWRD